MKRSQNIAWAQVKGGVLIVGALLLFAGGVVIMGDKTKFFIPKGDLKVIMADAGGLKVGAPVWVSGVDVGLVRDIHFAPPGGTHDVEIDLQIEREALRKIGADSRITIRTRGLLGEKYVDITPSTTVSETPLQTVYGTNVARLDDVMAKAGSAFDRLNGIMDKIDRGEGSLGRFTKDSQLYDHLVAVTAELKMFARSANSGEGTLGKLARSSEPYDRLIALLERADETLQQIGSEKGTIGSLMKDRRLYDRMLALAESGTKAADEVRGLSSRISSPDGTVGRLINEREFYDRGIALMERAEKSLASLQAVTARVEKGDGTAGRLVSDQELYDRMNRTVDSLDLLLKDIRENPGRYVKFSLF